MNKQKNNRINLPIVLCYNKKEGGTEMLLDEITAKIEFEIANWKKSTKDILGCSKKEAKEFLEELKKGTYNKVLSKEYSTSTSVLISWFLAMKKTNHHAITIDNYEVFKEMRKIRTHMKELLTRKTYTKSYQTPPTESEVEEINACFDYVMTTNFSPPECQTIKKNVAKLRIYEDRNFPHNIEEIILAFQPTREKISLKYQQDLPLKETKSMKSQVISLLEKEKLEKIEEIFKHPSTTKEEEYLRRMILSQVDIPSTIFRNYLICFQEALDYVKEELKISTNLSDIVSELIWKDSYIKRNTLMPLVVGVLKSLTGSEEILDLKKVCLEIQKDNNCPGKTVRYKPENQLFLSNNTIVYSIDPAEVENLFTNINRKYQDAYQNAHDYEFIESCIEIMGDIMLSQVFVQGNKRTAKCLFNRMLISRGILPPIVDLNEDEMSLWDSFTNSRYKYYQTAKENILSETKAMKNAWQNNIFNKPLIVSTKAINRDDFNSRYSYYR